MKFEYFVFTFLVLCCTAVSAQTTNDEIIEEKNYSPYELMSSYYKGDSFQPFKKRSVYFGLAFSVEDRDLNNVDYIVREVVEGERTNFNIQMKGGYYTGDYGMVGINISYFQNKFEGITFSDPNTIDSNSITRGFEVTPNFRSTVPLTKNERLSFYTMVGVTFGGSNTVTRDITNQDEINKSFIKNFDFRIGISPGITFFAMENFALEFQLNLLGYELNVKNITENDVEESRGVRQNVDFNIDLLSLDLGLSYYFTPRKKQKIDD